MATPPEDDFPTKTAADALRADRDRTGASKMTVEIEPERPIYGKHGYLSTRDPVVTEPDGSRPSAYNLVRKTDPGYELLRESRARAAEARELRAKALREPGGDDRSGASARPFEDKLRALGKTHTSRRIVRACDGLGPNAMTILAEIAERLQHGRAQYNDDFDKPRDWAQETFEELADGLVYSTQKLVELRQMHAADRARAEAANRGPSTAMPPVDMRHYNIDPRDGAAPAPTWPLTTPGEDWEKTRDGCG